jgi:catechol 2,3-dioxygenase-like lactoylglutathione lyase family enzyme
MKISPLLFVDAIEPSLAFWVDRLGFTKTVEVPGENGLGFVILEKEGVELMLQTVASVAGDMPSFADFARASRAALFIEVDDFEDLLRRLDGLDKSLPERTTDYGMREVGVFAPGGHMVTFAKPVAPAQH